MLERKRSRWTDNYTIFLGGLTEEEQMYRDYYETDIEDDPEDAYIEDQLDEGQLVETGEFNFRNFDFVETSVWQEYHESFDDVVEQKLFKYKYRRCNDHPELYEKRMGRVYSRKIERSKTRDKALEVNLIGLYIEDAKKTSIAQAMLDPAGYNPEAYQQTKKYREYMVKEAIQQYKDYYETDGEEQEFFQYVENLGNREKIRFAEIFEDLTIDKVDKKDFVTIRKREYNSELSLFSNLVLDLKDFQDRIKPFAKDIALMDVSRGYQLRDVNQLLREKEELRHVVTGLTDKLDRPDGLDEGYSSREVEEIESK